MFTLTNFNKYKKENNDIFPIKLHIHNNWTPGFYINILTYMYIVYIYINILTYMYIVYIYINILTYMYIVYIYINILTYMYIVYIYINILTYMYININSKNITIKL